MDFQATIDQLSALEKRSKPLADRYMSEEEREDFEDFVGTICPIYQSAIVFSTIGMNLKEIDVSQVPGILNGGIKAIEEDLRRQTLKDFFDKTNAFISPCSDSERGVVLKAWEPILGDIVTEFIGIERSIKESFFDTFSLPNSIDYVFSEYKKSFCIEGIPTSSWKDDELEVMWKEFQSAQAYANADDVKQRWRGWEEAFFNNRLKRAEWAFQWLQCVFFEEPEDELDQEESIESGVVGAFGYVYFVRNGDLYKIGITSNLLRIMTQLEPDEILNVVRCMNFQELEKDLHGLFKEVRLPQTEYFRLSEAQVSKVHKLMTSLAEF